MPSFFTTIDGVRLAYDDAGRGEPVLLVHGLGLRRVKWQSQWEMLRDAGYRVVRFDLRGFGESDVPTVPPDLARFVADIDELTAHLRLGRFHLVGHSLGGMTALRYAIDRPDAVRTLTLLSTTAHNGRRASEFGRFMALMGEYGFDTVRDNADLRVRMQQVLHDAFGDNAPPIEFFAHGLGQPNPAHSHAWGVTVGYSVKDDLGKIVCPVLVFHGTMDRVIPFNVGRQIHVALPGSGFVELEGASHLTPTERADEVNPRLLEFIDRHAEIEVRR